MHTGSSALVRGCGLRGCANAQLAQVLWATCRASTAFSCGRLGDATSAGEPIEWEQLPVVEQKEAIGDVAHAGELMRRDDGCRRGGASFANEAWAFGFTVDAEPVVDEEKSAGVLALLVHSSCVDEHRVEVSVDRSGVRA